MRAFCTASLAVIAVCAFGVSGDVTTAAETASNMAPPASVKQHWDLFDHYCVKCHNFTDWAGKVAFDTMTPDQIPDNQKIFETAIRKLRGGLMPPPGNPHPPHTEIAAFTSSLANYLDKIETAKGPNPGYVTLHRLNRTEYANAVRDLLGLDIDSTVLLPRDDSEDGYENMAAVLQVSPTFVEQYVSAAHTVVEKAIGKADAAPGSTTYVNKNTDAYMRHIEGLPLGTRGGMVVEHDFPADGEYVINIGDMVNAFYLNGAEFKNTVLVTIDGREVARVVVGGPEDMKAFSENGISAVDNMNNRVKNLHFKATAGQHKIGVSFLAGTLSESDDRLEGLVPGGGEVHLLHVSSFEIRGPFKPSGVSQTASRKKIFSCYPKSPDQMEPCAKEILGRLATSAYRRPVTDDDMADLMKFYQAGKQEGGFEDGIRMGLTAILASPDFLYRTGKPPANVAPGQIYKLSDIDLASELSFFLWSSIPDQELLDVAEKGRLHEPDVLEAEVKRMLADKKSESLVTDFAFHWLDMDRLDEITPDTRVFPFAAAGGDREENGDPRPDYRKELQLFIGSIFRENHNVLDLLTANYTYLNERVALLYGINDVRGNNFRRVTLTDPDRFGLLGKGAVLLATSYPNRTAPVLRGKFILDNFLGAPPNPPPPGVNTNLTVAEPGETPHTVRELMAQHRTKQSCNMCHGVMDPLGLALDNFDAVGEWRNKDRFAGTPIDATGQLPDGTKLDGPVNVRQALMRDPQLFVQTFTEELMKFALGRTLHYYDMSTVREIVRNAAKDDDRFSSIVMGIVTSEAFQERKAPEGNKNVPPVKQASAEE